MLTIAELQALAAPDSATPDPSEVRALARECLGFRYEAARRAHNRVRESGERPSLRREERRGALEVMMAEWAEKWAAQCKATHPSTGHMCSLEKGHADPAAHDRRPHEWNGTIRWHDPVDPASKVQP